MTEPTGKAEGLPNEVGEGRLFLVAPDKLKTSLPAIHSEEASSFLHRGLQCWKEIRFWEARPPGALKEGGTARMEREALTLKRLAGREWGQSAAQVTGKKEISE